MGGVGWVRGGHPSDQAPPGDSRPRATRSRARQRACSGKEPRNNKHVGPPPHNPSFSVLRERKKNLDWQRWPASPVATRVAPSAPALSTNRRRWGYGRPPAGGARSRCPNATASCSPRPPSAAAAVVWPLLLPPARAGARGGDRIDPPGKGRLGPHWRASRVAGGGEHADRNPTTRGSGGVGWARPAAGTGEKNLGVRGASVGGAAATGTTLAVRDRGGPCRRPLVFPVICFQPR